MGNCASIALIAMAIDAKDCLCVSATPEPPKEPKRSVWFCQRMLLHLWLLAQLLLPWWGAAGSSASHGHTSQSLFPSIVVHPLLTTSGVQRCLMCTRTHTSLVVPTAATPSLLGPKALRPTTTFHKREKN